MCGICTSAKHCHPRALQPASPIQAQLADPRLSSRVALAAVSMVRGRAGSRPARARWCACAILARARTPATAPAGGWEGWVWEPCGGRGRGPCAQGSPLPPPQMMGPEDAGACSGRKAELLPVPGPMGQDGKTVHASGGFGGGAVAAESPGEAGEEEAPRSRQLLQRYLAAAASPLQPGLGGAEAAAVPASCRSSMTNGDSGFLLRQDRRGPEEARRRRSCGHPCLLDPTDEGVDGPDDWAAPLEDPLRSCCLAAGDTDDPEPTAATSAARSGGSAEPSPGLPDARFSSRNTFEVSRRQSAGDLLPSAGTPASLPTAEQSPGGTTARTRRSGGFADFFARYRTGRAGVLGGARSECRGRQAAAFQCPSASGLSFDL